MADEFSTLITGATGNQGFSVANAVLDRGGRVRALVRNPEHDRAKRLLARGAELVRGDFEHPETLGPALSGVRALFAITTPSAGLGAEVEHGRALIDAAVAAGIEHFVFSSVADANKQTGIGHFDSKFEIEQYLQASSLTFTITAPAFFYDNVMFPWNLGDLRTGKLRQALSPELALQQVSVRDIGRFNALVLDRGPALGGRRIDYAGDSVTGPQMAASLSRHSGRAIRFETQPLDEIRAQFEDMATMYEWFANAGFSVNIPALHAEFSEVEWLSFDAWAATQPWPQLLTTTT